PATPELAVRGAADAPHPVVVAEDPAHLLAAPDVPQPHRLVVAARQDALAVGRKDATEQLGRVALQAALRAVALLEQVDGVVHATGQGELAVRRERHAGYPRRPPARGRLE